jgi:hypothetical protein
MQCQVQFVPNFRGSRAGEEEVVYVFYFVGAPRADLCVEEGLVVQVLPCVESVEVKEPSEYLDFAWDS